MRSIHGYCFFPNVLFHAKDMPEKQYALDFWLDDKNGTVTVGEVRLHKVPQQEAVVWVQIPRYNFDGLNFEEVK